MPIKKVQNEFQEFYTKCNYITQYMVDLLKINNNSRILEPCAGDGAFIDEIIKQNFLPSMDLLELNKDSIDNLKNKYSRFKNINIYYDDYILNDNNVKYDKIIANPPYGAYQSKEKKILLKQKYKGLFVKETYGLFLIKAIESLKENGNLVFIIPDTFLTLHMHEGLRKKLLQDVSIESITLFPSKFFPNVNFAYAGLSIISIINKVPTKNYKFPIYGNLSTKDKLIELTTSNKKNYELCKLAYRELLSNNSFAFFMSTEKWVSKCMGNSNTTIGDVCDVVTGFYSGNDAQHLRKDTTVKNKKYMNVDTNNIYNNLFDSNLLDGLSGTKHWIPIVKGGNQRFYKKNLWFMEWSKASVYSYKVTNKKKARFQNSQFYFKQGVAVPMVSSSSITGSLIEYRLFDQSIVGVFPKDKHLTFYILGFFNSKVCNSLIRTINASTNNSSNYIKKIPFIKPSKQDINLVNNEVNKLLEESKKSIIKDDDLMELNKIFDNIYEINIEQ